METAIMVSFITLVAGFVGGVVFSAYKMETSLPTPSAVMVAGESETEPELTADQEKKIEALERAAAETPKNPDAWIALGNACFDYNLPEKAIVAYETALKLQPDNADVWTDVGIMYRRMGDSEKAVTAFEKAQDVSPGHEMSLLNMGIVRLHDLNDSAGALTAWQKLIQIDPSATTASGMPIWEIVDALKSQQ